MRQRAQRITGVARLLGPAVTVLGLGTMAQLAAGPSAAGASPLTLCGNPGSPSQPVQHVMVVMLENQSYPAVVGPGTKAPYENGTLATQCGLASQMYGVTHTSAANYLAMSAGTYPPKSVNGCFNVAACSSTSPNLFRQLDSSGAGWKAYEESMPSSCDPSGATAYKIGHNPALFYGLARCASLDVGVPDLTAQSGALWTDLSNQTLPAFSFVTPNLNDDGEGPTRLAGADAWLAKFLGTVQQSAAYQAGTTAIVVTYDEGTGPDSQKSEDCTNKTLDLAGSQPSCHVAAFVVYPWASGTDSTFFDHYSLTRTVEELFGLPLLAGAATAPSLVGHFGLALPPPPKASFTSSCTYLACTFDSSASRPPLSSQTPYSWDFGDGSGGQGASPSHAYAGAGTYPVTLTVTNVAGVTGSATQSLSVAPAPVTVASFTASCTLLACTFDGSASTAPGGVASYAWDFGDGGTGTGAAPTETFPSPGTYPVTLTVTGSLGDVASSTVSIAVAPPPTAAFTSSCEVLTCTVDGTTSTSSSPLTYSWDYGDGGTDSGPTPSAHTFATPGSYPVTLTVLDAFAETSTVTHVLTVPPPAPIAFVAAVGTAANASTESVTVPGIVATGDGLLLIATSASAAPQSAPPGWTLAHSAGSALMDSTVWQRVAAPGDAGTKVTVTFGTSQTKGALTLVAYAGTSSSGPVLGPPAARTGVSSTSSFRTPSVTVPTAGVWVLSYWSSRSTSVTGWTLPAGQVVRATANGSGGGHINAVLADAGAATAPGPAGGLTGTTDFSTGADLAWTILLAPGS